MSLSRMSVIGLLLLSPSIFLHISKSYAALMQSETMMEVSLIRGNRAEERLQVNSESRLYDLLNSQFDIATAPWHLIQVGSKQLEYRSERLRAEVLDELSELPQSAAVRQLYLQLQRMVMSAAFYREIKWHELRLSFEQNPRLLTTYNNDRMIIRQRTPTNNVEVYGITSELESLPVPTAETEELLSTLVDNSDWAPQANKNVLWKIAANGDIARIPIAAHNSHLAAECYFHDSQAPLLLGQPRPCFPNMQLNSGDRIYIELAIAALPNRFQDLNHKIVILLKHALSSSYVREEVQ